MSTHLKSKRFVVQGRVQGVGFRAATREAAKSLGLRGWVRNQADGSVLTLAAGEAEAMQRFETWLKYGPSAARVDVVSSSDVELTDLPMEFEIAR